LELRAQTLLRHSQNKELHEQLQTGLAHLETLKTDYHANRAALESAYQLNLD
jgi:hypothetical protein